MNLRFSQSASNDLFAIGEWIARDSPDRAVEFVVEIETACRRLLDFPLTGARVGRYQKEDVRKKVHGDDLVLYTIQAQTVFVVRIVHGAQDYTRFID